MSSTLFPVFLKTETAHFLIVGGGNVGLEKTETLLRQNPEIHITIVAPIIYPALKKIIENHKNINSFERPFHPDDLENIDYAIIGTDNPTINLQIRELAKEKKIKVNAADQPALCDFYLGSIVNKGNLKIAISTNGKSPVLAKRMREYFEEAIPDSIDQNIEELYSYRNKLSGNFSEKLAELNKITSVLTTNNSKETKKYKKIVLNISVLFIIFFVGYGVSTFLTPTELTEYLSEIPNEFYGMLLIGFIAQLVDGALGLGYGITCATSMMMLGLKLPAISGSIHTAEMFSSAISGYTHYKFGNVNKKLFWSLVIPAVIGAVVGAQTLVYMGTKYQTFSYVILSVYTMIIGIRLITIAFRKKIQKQKVKNVGVLGFSGGFLDAFGGGGWGPIVTSTLLSKGRKSQYVIGTVSLVEFFVTFAAAAVFFVSLGVSHWHIILGLILGGSLAAPIAAKLVGKIPQKTALLLVAFLVIVFSLRTFLKII